MELSLKQKLFSHFFAVFLKSGLTFDILKTKMNLKAFVFPKLWTPKTSLDKCLKSLVSEDSSISNIVNFLKHCWNLHHNPLIKFIAYCQGNWAGKSLSYWHAKSWDCLLTHWLPITSILFLIDTILWYQCRCNNLSHKKILFKFWLCFDQLKLNFKCSEKKMTLIDFVFTDSENVVR